MAAVLFTWEALLHIPMTPANIKSSAWTVESAGLVPVSSDSQGLEDMSKELWLAEGKKRNPSPSFIRNMGRKILHETVSAPVQSAKSLLRDVTGMPPEGSQKKE